MSFFYDLIMGNQYLRNLNQLKKRNMDKKSIWKLVIQTLVTILTAIGTTLGVTSCL